MPEVGEIMPGTNEKIVGKIYNEGGAGYWLQGENGGVFAMEGAPYLGSYFDPAMAQHRNDPNRTFSGIRAVEGGGYESMIAGGTTGYAFRPTATAPTTAAPAALTPEQQRAADPNAPSAKSELASTLALYGLPASLADQLWDNEYIKNGTPINTIVNLVLPKTTEYQQRFPGLTALRERQNRGEAVQIPSIKEYIALEAGIAGVLQDAGLPPGFYDDPSDFATFIGGSTSPKEVEDRIGYARNVAFSMPVETREELGRVYGLDLGEIIAYVLDPAKGLEAIQKVVLGTGIGGAAKRTGFGLLTQQEMEQLAGSGVTEAAAGQRFGELVPQAGLFSETAGETMVGDQLGRGEQIGYAGGSAAAATSIQTRRTRRQAQFAGGGGAASGGEGRTGLG